MKSVSKIFKLPALCLFLIVASGVLSVSLPAQAASFLNCNFYFDQSIDMARALNKAYEIQTRESRIGVPEYARTNIHIEKDEAGNPIRTPISIVMYHGLYNHPGWMKPMEDVAKSLGINFINKRIPGHYESPRKNLDEASQEEWRLDARETAEIASQLGEKVVYVGHSTGGLISLLSVLKNLDRVGGLIGFSTSLKVNPKYVNQAKRLGPYKAVRWLNNTINLIRHARDYVTATLFNLDTPQYRYISIPAGAEVSELAEFVNIELEDLDEVESEILKHLPVLFVDVENDSVVDFPTNVDFISSLNNADHLIISANEKVSHKKTASGIEDGNSAAEKVFTTVRDFLASLVE